MSTLPVVHPRHFVVQEAKHELLDFILSWKDKHKLTISEELFILNDQVHSLLGLCVRAEREDSSA